MNNRFKKVRPDRPRNRFFVHAHHTELKRNCESLILTWAPLCSSLQSELHSVLMFKQNHGRGGTKSGASRCRSQILTTFYACRILVGGTILTLATVGAIAFGTSADPFISASHDCYFSRDFQFSKHSCNFREAPVCGLQKKTTEGDFFPSFAVACDFRRKLRKRKNEGSTEEDQCHPVLDRDFWKSLTRNDQGRLCFR